MNTKIISLDGQLTPAELNRLYMVVGWNRDGLRTDEKTATMLQQTRYYVTARTNHQLVGFARILSDVYVAQIVDVIVAPGFRRKGIASQMMTALVEFARSQNYFGVMLVAGSGLGSFYEKFGFHPADMGQDLLMYLRRPENREPVLERFC